MQRITLGSQLATIYEHPQAEENVQDVATSLPRNYITFTVYLFAILLKKFLYSWIRMYSVETAKRVPSNFSQPISANIRS